jgi:hypothetical protein
MSEVTQADRNAARKAGETILRNLSGSINYELQHLAECFAAHRIAARQIAVADLVERLAGVDGLGAMRKILDQSLDEYLCRDAAQSIAGWIKETARD